MVMRMGNINVYVPDELAERLRASGVSISPIAQEAFRRHLDGGGSGFRHPLTPAVEGWYVKFTVSEKPWNVEIAAWDADGHPLICLKQRLHTAQSYADQYLRGATDWVVGFCSPFPLGSG